jgi:hypothetical protein
MEKLISNNRKISVKAEHVEYITLPILYFTL